MATKKQVIVVGGGGYGAAIAHALSPKLNAASHDLTLITPREFYLHFPGLLRTVVTDEGKLEERIFIPYSGLFTKGVGKLMQGVVTSIKKNEDGKSGTVTLASGEELPWDVLVLAPGNKWEGALDLPETKEKAYEVIKAWRGKFKDAKKIILVGGGAVGIELSGELRDVYDKKEKEITIIHTGKHLVNDAYPDKFRKDVEKRAKKRHVEVVLGETVKSIPESGSGTVETESGKKYEGDLIVASRGGKPNTKFVADSLGENVIAPGGRIKVKPTFLVEGETNIFADGDAADTKEQHKVGKSFFHMDIVAQNVLSILQGAEPKKTYTPMKEFIFLTLGKKHGAGFIGPLWGLTVGDKATSAVKGKGLFIDMTRGALGVKD